MATTTESSTKNEKETPWIDAWARWPRNPENEENDDDNNAEEEDDPPFQVGVETFTVSFSVPDSTESSSTTATTTTTKTTKSSIDIELKGFSMESEQIWNSTGLTLWHSAYHLGDYLIQNASEIFVPNEATIIREKEEREGDHKEPMRILELGSGLGLCGILVHKLLRRRLEKENGQCIGIQHGEENANPLTHTLTLTDGDTDALAQLRDNVERNCTGSIYAPITNLATTSLDVCQLLWGKETSEAFSEKRKGEKRNCYYDIIFGSDLIYVPSNIPLLLETIQVLLRPKTGKFYFAYCTRRNGGSTTIELVLEQAQSIGMKYERISIHSNDTGRSQTSQDEDDIFLYQFEWES